MTSDFKKYTEKRNDEAIELIVEGFENKGLFEFAKGVRKTYEELKKNNFKKLN